MIRPESNQHEGNDDNDDADDDDDVGGDDNADSNDNLTTTASNHNRMPFFDGLKHEEITFFE